MKKGDIIKARTNAKLINELFGTNYKAWMKSVYDYGENRIWMIHIDNRERNGWKNFKVNDMIVEENLYPCDYSGLRVDVRELNKRVVFSKHDGYFIFEGVYKYDKAKSNPSNIRYYNLISEEF